MTIRDELAGESMEVHEPFTVGPPFAAPPATAQAPQLRRGTDYFEVGEGVGAAGAASAGAGAAVLGVVAAAGTAGVALGVAAGLAAVAGSATWSSTPLAVPRRMIDSARLVTTKTPARIVVARDSTVAEPRGPKAVCVPPPPKALARSWPLPCCSNTTAIRNRHAITCRTTTR